MNSFQVKGLEPFTFRHCQAKNAQTTKIISEYRPYTDTEQTMTAPFQIIQPSLEQLSFSAKKGKRTTRMKARIPNAKFNSIVTAIPTERMAAL